MTRPPIDRAFDPERFRAEGHAVIDALADYLQRARRAAPELAVLPDSDPDRAVERWARDFSAPDPSARLAELLPQVLAGSNHLHHPRYVGHQVTAPLPGAALAELVGALLNNGMAVYDMGPVSTAMERQVVRWMARTLGFAAGDGVLTSGGSAGNLTALLAARQVQSAQDVWRRGLEGQPIAVLCSDQAHYSVRRAVAIMGAGEEGVQTVPVDSRFRMRPDALPAALAAARARGRRAIALVGSACSTATGAFDPLAELADFAEAEGLWFHVDGAHGAALALSPRHRPLLAGVERARSVVWDAHKMLLMPALLTGVLFREPAHSYAAFSQQASYLFGGTAPEQEWFNLGSRTLECTKRMMSLELYSALAEHGAPAFGEYVGRMVDLARSFAALIRAQLDFELAVEPDCNIVCFRHRPEGLAGPALDEHQARLRARVIACGSYYLVQARLPAGLFLRTTIINPATEEADLAGLLAALRAAAAGSGAG